MQGVCAELSSDFCCGAFSTGVCQSVCCAGSRLNNDEEEFFSAESDVEPTSTANSQGKHCSTGVSLRTTFFKGAWSRFRCTRTAFGVPHRPGTTRPNVFSGCGLTSLQRLLNDLPSSDDEWSSRFYSSRLRLKRRMALLLTPNGSAEFQGGCVHAVLDREVPGPACPFLKKKACDAFLEKIYVAELDDFERRCVDRQIIFTRTLRSVSDQLSARGSCATLCCDVWGAGAWSTSCFSGSGKYPDPTKHSGRSWLSQPEMSCGIYIAF
eukprot:3227067-Amphidinium_carterae.1